MRADCIWHRSDLTQARRQRRREKNEAPAGREAPEEPLAWSGDTNRSTTSHRAVFGQITVVLWIEQEVDIQDQFVLPENVADS